MVTALGRTLSHGDRDVSVADTTAQGARDGRGARGGRTRRARPDSVLGNNEVPAPPVRAHPVPSDAPVFLPWRPARPAARGPQASPLPVQREQGHS